MERVLKILLFFLASTSLITACIMIIDASGWTLGLNKSILESTIFHDYFIPGLLLLFFQGIPLSIAIIRIYSNKPAAYKLTFLATVTGVIWTISQLIILTGYIGITIPYLIISLITMLISVQLMGKWAM